MPYNMYNGLGMEPVYGQPMQQPYMQPHQSQMMQQQIPQPQMPKVDPRMFDTPTITSSGDGTMMPTFSVSDNGANTITVVEPEKPKKREKRKKEVGDASAIVRANGKSSPESVSGEVEDPSTIYTYQETNGLLHETLGQIDAINVELVQEFNNVRQNRTMKNKYNILTNLSENIGSMLSNRIATIKEINNCITKANDLDYKKFKDVQAAKATMNDDKYITDLYQAFLQNPAAQAPSYQMPAVDQSILGSGIVRANVTQGDMQNTGVPMDVGYLNYIANLTPEQNLMRYENDPNVQQVVVYDAQSGAKFFQMMNVATGEVIPNVPVYDQMMMENTTLDLNTGIAKNLDLNETFKIVQINNNVTSQY